MKSITVHELRERAGTPLVDVREEWEFESAHVPGAVNLPMSVIGERLDELPDGAFDVICKVGGRSAQAAAYLLQQGYDVVNLDGGMLDWQAAGRAMVSETGRPPQVV